MFKLAEAIINARFLDGERFYSKHKAIPFFGVYRTVQYYVRKAFRCTRYHLRTFERTLLSVICSSAEELSPYLIGNSCICGKGLGGKAGSSSQIRESR
ncbi:hypothetical protein CDAR_596591 [Caerostris darwini]|uniref:Uncharacterized protein n=1 Tax=Caerostris darwini TaxID=1538125 RepID=A0AAV4WDW7_9ARAC|nr:hypothetical protein CDAR_596591 [Caerostris darwini]